VRRELSLLVFLVAQSVAPSHAIELAGVVLPDRVQPEGADQVLVLNGAGVREKFFIDIYVAALYLPQARKVAGTLLSEPSANRLAMHFVHSEVSKRKLDAAWYEGFERNSTAAQFAAVQDRLQQFVALFGDMREGDTVWLDFLPGIGTRVSINGSRVGLIAGDDFNSALLAVWLGKKPVTQALKKALVGVDKQ